MDEPTRGGDRVVGVAADADPTVVDALGDPTCRALLRAADTPETAKELAVDCDLPLSTVYRKLDLLADTPLVEQSTRPRLRGKHPSQYRRAVDTVRVDVTAHHPFGGDASDEDEDGSD
ncbi:MAG: helix-turn-helix domain-containing protein [Haloarculaceae archaeon]